MLGRNCKVYYLSTGNRATWGVLNVATGRIEGIAPTLTEIVSVKDVALPGDRMNATQTDRGADYETGDTGAMQGNVTLTLNHRATDTERVSLETAYILGTSVALAILNGDAAVEGTTGLWADFKVMKFVENQPETDHVTYDVELMVDSESAVDPEWVYCEAEPES